MDWFNGLPKMSRSFAGCLVVTAACVSWGVSFPFMLFLDWRSVFRGQVRTRRFNLFQHCPVVIIRTRHTVPGCPGTAPHPLCTTSASRAVVFLSLDRLERGGLGAQHSAALHCFVRHSLCTHDVCVRWELRLIIGRHNAKSVPPVVLTLATVQVWRLATHVFFADKLGFRLLFQCIWVLTYGSALESGTYSALPEDYLFLFIFATGCFTLVSLILGPLLGLGYILFTGSSMVMTLLYVWSKEFSQQVRD